MAFNVPTALQWTPVALWCTFNSSAETDARWQWIWSGSVWHALWEKEALLEKKRKKKKGARLIFSSLLCAWRQIKYTGGAQISAHRLGKKEKVTGVEKKSEIRWMCEIAVMVIWCAVDPVIGMKSHVLKTTFKQSGFFFFKIVPWIIISAQLSKDLYTTRAQGSLCFFFFFFFSPRFFTHPSVISGVSRVLTPRPPVSSAFRQLKRRFMDFFFRTAKKSTHCLPDPGEELLR